jgi:hypothetical protein
MLALKFDHARADEVRVDERDLGYPQFASEARTAGVKNSICFKHLLFDRFSEPDQLYAQLTGQPALTISSEKQSDITAGNLLNASGYGRLTNAKRLRGAFHCSCATKRQNRLEVVPIFHLPQLITYNAKYSKNGVSSRLIHLLYP